jgi:hypothetical protein
MERPNVSGYNSHMDQKKKAFQLALMGIAVVAILMVGFYYFKDQMRKGENAVDFSEASGESSLPKSEKSEFVGMYTPDGPLEAKEKRIAFFMVNRAEDGGYLGSAKVDTVGSDQSIFFRCVDVKIEEKDFFLNCKHETEGAISLNGTWSKESGQLLVDGKVLWSYQSQPILEIQRKFQFMPE